MTKQLQIRGNRVVKAFLLSFALVSLLALATVGLPSNGRPDESSKRVRRGGSQDHSGIAAVPARQFHPHQVSKRKRGRRNADQSQPRDQRMVSAQGCMEGQSLGDLAFHLENTEPEARKLLLDENYPAGVVIADGKDRYVCDLFGGDALDQAKTSQLVFAPLCDGRVYLRNAAVGHRTTLEAATEFLREHVWGGEKIIALGHILLGEMHRETGKIVDGGAGFPGGRKSWRTRRSPLPALDRFEIRRSSADVQQPGNRTGGSRKNWHDPGSMVCAGGTPGVYVSILQPNLIDPVIMQSYKTTVNNLGSMEASALCYLIAFDLDQFELGYALGTEHPSVEWSDHILEQMRNPMLPGPDGIGSISPLVATGLVSPEDAPKTVATFTGGFKRLHGAFIYGDLALKNHGSHYGFVENGVVFSKLQPGLATILVLDDGSIEMKTWGDADNRLLARIRHARQNGVPVIEFDDAVQVAGSWPSSRRLGTGQLVRFGRQETAHDALGCCVADESWEAVLDLRRVL